jgi:quercetin dioxygenase-like cupin family protein
MPLVDVSTLAIRERLPGWRGRYFHSAKLTVAHYEFARGASIHEHHHVEKEIYELPRGSLS